MLQNSMQLVLSSLPSLKVPPVPDEPLLVPSPTLLASSLQRQCGSERLEEAFFSVSHLRLEVVTRHFESPSAHN